MSGPALRPIGGSVGSGPTRIPHILYGGDYSPEQWPEEVWADDARLMQEAGVNLVSLGIFAWGRLQPGPDRYDLGWLDRVVDLLWDRGVAINLATPTASPPPWLVKRHPDILPVNADGVTLWHGSRRHICPHSPAYREAAIGIVRALAGHFRDHPALAMWHVDNEYSCHVTECFCDTSAGAFRVWLRARYGSLDSLNAAWGTAFWSQTYGDWEEIAPPRRAPTFINPTQLLDWRRFTSDSWLACFDDQAAILRELTPTIPITTNFMGFHKPLDYWTWATHEDVVSNDAYPDTSEPEWMIDAAMTCDLIRSLGSGRPWILMEQATAHVNWRTRNPGKRPGVMRLGSFQAVARGADGIMFFQWRASAAGSEKYHSAMIPHTGTASRAWHEVRALGDELARLDELVGSEVTPAVAILLDWHDWWALENDGKPSNDLLLVPAIRAWYAALFARHVSVDFAHPSADLSRYRLVIAPLLYLVEDASIANLKGWVERGGTLVLSFFSGIVDGSDHIRLGERPGFASLAGIRFEEYTPLADSQTNVVRTDDGQRFGASRWCDVLGLEGAEAIATYEGDYVAGRPALTRRACGSGSVFHAGTTLDPGGMAWLLDRACTTAGIEVRPDVPHDLELLERTDGTTTWLFALNHAPEAVTLPLLSNATEILSGRPVSELISIAPGDVAIIRTR